MGAKKTAHVHVTNVFNETEAMFLPKRTTFSYSFRIYKKRNICPDKKRPRTQQSNFFDILRCYSFSECIFNEFKLKLKENTRKKYQRYAGNCSTNNNNTIIKRNEKHWIVFKKETLPIINCSSFRQRISQCIQTIQSCKNKGGQNECRFLCVKNLNRKVRTRETSKRCDCKA